MPRKPRINPADTEACNYDVPDYGVCGRAKTHVVHQMLGVSPVEHPYQPRKLATKNVEETRLSKRKIKYIARRSGKSVDELEMMRQVALKEGRVLTLRYEVVEEQHPIAGITLKALSIDETQEV